MSGAALGDLVIRLAGDIAQFELAMTRAEQLVNRTADSIDSAMDRAATSVKKLAEAYVSFEAIKAFAEQVDDAAKFASSLEVLSQRLGISASDLSSFKLVADQSGTSLQSVAQGISVLGRSMYDTMQGTGRAKIAFESLGLSVTDSNGHLKDASKFFVELSTKLAGLSSATERNAVAQKVMRGVGSELVPVMLALADGAERNALVTDAQALAAKHYTDALAELHELHEKFFLVVSQQVTPVLEALVRSWVNLGNQQGSVLSTTKDLAAQNQIKQWAVDAGIAISMVIDGLRYVAVGIQIVIDAVKILANSAVTGFEIIVGALGTAFASLEDLGTLMRGVAEIMAGQFTAGMADVNQALDGFKAGWGGFFDDAKKKAQGLAMNVDGLAGDIEQLMANFKQGGATQAFLDALDAINMRVDKVKKGVGGAGDTIKDFKASAVDALISSLDKQKAKLDAELDSWNAYGKAAENVTFAEVMAKMNEDAWIQTINKIADSRKAAGQTAADWIHQVQTQIIIEAQAIDQEKVWLDAIKARDTAEQNAFKTVADNVERQKEANAVYGLGVGAVADYNLALLQERLNLEKVVPDNQIVVASITAQIAAWKDLRAATIQGKELQDTISGWKDLASTIGDSASSMIMNWGHAIETMRSLLKSLLADMIKIFMQKWVLTMVANAYGGTGSQIGNVLLSQAAQQGQGTFIGNIYNAFAGQSGAASTFGPPDMNGGAGYSDTYFNDGGASMAGPGIGGYLGGAAGGAIAGYGMGSMFGQLWGNNRNQQGMAVGGAVGGAVGMAAGMAMGAEYGSVAGPIGMVIGAIIGALIGGLVKSGGGPKQQGVFAGEYSGSATGGTLLNALNGALITDINGDNQMASVAQKMVGTLADNFYKAAAVLGGPGATLPNMQFGLGFSTDPAGTAPGFIHSSVRDAAGNIIYQHYNDDAPRDTAQFQTELDTEAERMIVASFQHMDLGPELNDLFKTFGDVTHATKDDLDALLAAAADLKTALVTIDALSKGQFGINLSLDDIKGYQQAGETLTATVNRVGGAWVNLVSQFETPMNKLNDEKSNLATLYSTLQQSGLQIPKTREDWLKVMQSIDQSTVAGRTLFLQMLQLAPAFDDVTKAAESMMNQFDQLMGQERPGYTTGQQQGQLSDALTQFMSANGWTAGHDAAWVLEQLHTITREDFAGYSTSNQQLILTILGLDDTIKGNTAAVQQAMNPSYGGDAYTAALAKYSGMFDTRFGNVISGGADTSTKITTQIGTTQDFINELKGREAALEAQYAGYLLPAEYYAIQQVITQLSNGLPTLSTELAKVTILEAQYGKQKGDQLYDLQNWYDQEKQLIGSNQTALLALEQEYQDKRNAIISGGSSTGLQSWQTGLQTFLNDLLTGTNSPLSPMEQLQQAQAHFQDVLNAASGGDTTAQGEVQGAASSYLNAARAAYASGPMYNDIFRQVYDEIAGIASAPTYEDRMSAAIPEGKLASGADVARVEAAVAELTTVLASGITVTDPALISILQQLSSKASTTGTGVFA